MLAIENRILSWTSFGSLRPVSPAGVHTRLGLGGRPTFKYGKGSWLDGKEKICKDCRDRILCNFVCWCGLWK